MGLFDEDTKTLTSSVTSTLIKGAQAVWNFPQNTLPDDSTLGQNKYTWGNTVFPEDLSTSQQGHYMVININVPVTNGTARSKLDNEDVLTGEMSKVDVLRYGLGPSVNGAPNRELFSVPRFTRRIAKSIALFMPTPIIYGNDHDFSEIKLTPLVGGGIGTIVGALSKGAITPNPAGGAAAGLLRYPVNPRVEVIFSNTQLRTFEFHWLMAPESEKESEAMQDIIYALRYFAAPELQSETGGFTFIPPAEFDITFYHHGTENDNIPKINTCVLEKIGVTYNPAGAWASFSNGHPVAAELSLSFREVEILHKKRIKQGF